MAVNPTRSQLTNAATELYQVGFASSQIPDYLARRYPTASPQLIAAALTRAIGGASSARAVEASTAARPVPAALLQANPDLTSAVMYRVSIAFTDARSGRQTVRQVEVTSPAALTAAQAQALAVSALQAGRYLGQHSDYNVPVDLNQAVEATVVAAYRRT
jgi:hypothetical protein